MTAAIDITTAQRKTLSALLRRFIPGVAVWAYGSRVKWTARLNSDLDLVAFTTPAQRNLVSELKDALDESDLPFLVDFHVWDEVPERFHEIIRKEFFVLQEARHTEVKSGMAGEWETVPLQQLVAPGRGISYGIVQPGSSTVDGVPIVRVNDVRNGRISTASPMRVTRQIEAAYSRTRLEGGELLLTLVGTVGETAVVPASLRGWNTARAVGVIPVRDEIGAYWVQLALRSPAVRHLIDSRLNTTVQATLNLGDVAKLPIVLPPRPQREKIAHILGTLDDKIELNRRMNETLEEMARALFKSWFVDFDPVHAKAEGRDPGLPQPLADLFPDSFADSELGEIPKGWEVKRFADTVDIIGGGTPKTSVAEYWDGDIPWFSVVDAPSNSEVWVVDTAKKITREGIENSSTRILSVGTTIISARGTVGRIALVAVPMAMNQSCYGLRGKAGTHGFFTYYATRELVTRLQQHAHGSVFDTITQDTIAGVSLALPPAALIETFETRIGPALERIRASLLSSRTLAALRDTLLPRLISGELRVKEAERFAEAHL